VLTPGRGAGGVGVKKTCCLGFFNHCHRGKGSLINGGPKKDWCAPRGTERTKLKNVRYLFHSKKKREKKGKKGFSVGGERFGFYAHKIPSIGKKGWVI